MAIRPVEASQVDRVVGAAQDKLSALARVAQVTGDPSGPVLDALVAMLAAQHRLFEETKQTLAETGRPAPSAFTGKQVDELAQRLAQSCAVWSGGLVKAANRKSAAIMLATVLAAVVGGAAGSWVAFGKPLHPVCVDIQGGGRVCGEWTIPPPLTR